MSNKLTKTAKYLFRPSTWRTFAHAPRFILRHGLKQFNRVLDDFEKSYAPVSSESQAHAEVWERIKPRYVELVKMRSAIPNLLKQPRFSIVATDEASIASITKQIYDNYEIVCNAETASGDFVLVLRPGDMLHRDALFEIAVELNRADELPAFVSFDYDCFVGETIDNPHYNQPYYRACAFRRDVSVAQELPAGGRHCSTLLLTIRPDGNEPPPTAENKSPVLCRMLGSPTISPELMKKILVVKLDHIGDAVLTLPAVRKLRRLCPKATIDMLCGSYVKDFWEQQPEVDNVYVYNVPFASHLAVENTGKWEKTAERLRREYYDLCINLRRDDDTLDFTTDLADFTMQFSDSYNKHNVSHPVPALQLGWTHKPLWHLRDQMLAAVDKLNYDKSLDRAVTVSDADKARVDAYVRDNEFFNGAPIVGMHIGSGKLSSEWPLDKFTQLCEMIIERLDAKIVLVGGNAEVKDNKTLIEKSRYGKAIISTAAEFSLVETARLVRYFDYFVANDSGPAHIAGIQGVPTVVILTKSANLEEFAPIGNTLQVEYNDADTSFAVNLGDPPACTAIMPDDVYAAFERLMLLFPSRRIAL
ncbi:hypothetical protein FACS1894202_07690 [Clostridia bacterium]|nr:hypothetical protein FACS1894202_07690 [Clostridia bacterium]